MTSALERLLSLRDASDRFDVPPEELLPSQLEAATERFESQIERIPLLKNRADAAGARSIAEAADLVPLLFAHSTYKSYAEPWLVEGQWDRMARWLQTVSTYEVGGSRFDGVEGLEPWLARLGEQGCYVSCSSGTTGKPAMLGMTEGDLDFSSWSNVSSLSWSTGTPAASQHKFLGLEMRMNLARIERTRLALLEGFSSENEEPYYLPVPPIAVSSLISMIMLRRRIGDGTASPSDVAEFERLSSERMAGIEGAMGDAAETLIKHREKKLLLAGMFRSLYPIAMRVRDQGYGGTDFGPDNVLMLAGGLKGMELPPDHREVVLGTFNIEERRVYELYSMQEINTPFPKCAATRYHIAPWVMALPLDAPGEQLLDASGGEIEARAAFLDLSLEGRWGGIISGDRVHLDFGRCPCGHQGPTVGREIVRYADLDGGDKITCAGTIDAYVKGAS